MGVGIAAALVALGVHVTRDQRHLRPDRAEMEAVVGAPLAEPTYTSSSRYAGWKHAAGAWWRYATQPLPNQMAYTPEGDAWTYAVELSLPYTPPPGPLTCAQRPGRIECQGEASGGWTYTLHADAETGRGVFVAQNVPR